ncbi:MAG: BPSS1780 family membrane protein [Limnohabitans sp.]
MQLNIVPARAGLNWARQGMRTFWRQPLAMSCLFFLFMAAVSLVSIVPVVGGALALVLLPALTLGMMAATEVAEDQRFPLPGLLFTALKSGPQRSAMLQLGAVYALGFLIIMGASALVDGGTFARVYLTGANMSPEVVNSAPFQAALWVSMVLYIPLAMMFWHAPALVHWQGLSPAKSLFFSFVACARNLRAFMVYVAVWFGVFIAAATLSMLVTSLLGEPSLLMTLLMPAGLMVAAMFFTSMVYSVRDCFLIARTDH